MSYPEHPLSTRAIVKPGLWAVLPEGGLVNNVIPAIKGCRVSIVASPKMGASFVQYIRPRGMVIRRSLLPAKKALRALST